MLNLIFSLKKECAKVRFIIYITNRVLEIIFTNTNKYIFLNFNKKLRCFISILGLISVTFLKRTSLIIQAKSKLIINEKINIFYIITNYISTS